VEKELHITDDASAVELLKKPVALVENPHANPKLTTPADLPWFEYLLAAQTPPDSATASVTSTAPFNAPQT
jgi:2-C-methyl-D-erythritol 4-phosphate cytidylyltransferase